MIDVPIKLVLKTTKDLEMAALEVENKVSGLWMCSNGRVFA
jgi:hypothetical protein